MTEYGKRLMAERMKADETDCMHCAVVGSCMGAWSVVWLGCLGNQDSSSLLPWVFSVQHFQLLMIQ